MVHSAARRVACRHAGSPAITCRNKSLLAGAAPSLKNMCTTKFTGCFVPISLVIVQETIVYCSDACVIEFTSSDTKRLYTGWLYVRSNSRHQIVTALVVDRLGNNFILGRDRQISVCDRIRVINYQSSRRRLGNESLLVRCVIVFAPSIITSSSNYYCYSVLKRPGRVDRSIVVRSTSSFSRQLVGLSLSTYRCPQLSRRLLLIQSTFAPNGQLF